MFIEIKGHLQGVEIEKVIPSPVKGDLGRVIIHGWLDGKKIVAIGSGWVASAIKEGGM